MDRLIYVISVAPKLAPQAARRAAEYIHTGRNPNLYNTLLEVYEVAQATSASLGQDIRPLQEVVAIDTKWAEEISARNEQERTKLEVELRTYTNNMIKESVRVRVD